jgi:hypothetical protein
MGFNRPTDMAFIFAIFAMVMITVGYGVTSVMNQQNASIDSDAQNYFNKLKNNDLQAFGNNTNDINNALVAQEGQSDSPTEENILVRGFNSMLSIGRSFTLVTESLDYIATKTGIPDEFVVIIGGLLIMTLAVVTYSWLRGANL